MYLKTRKIHIKAFKTQELFPCIPSPKTPQTFVCLPPTSLGHHSDNAVCFVSQQKGIKCLVWPPFTKHNVLNFAMFYC